MLSRFLNNSIDQGSSQGIIV